MRQFVWDTSAIINIKEPNEQGYLGHGRNLSIKVERHALCFTDSPFERPLQLVST
jgi:hypothetical protein